MPTPVTRLLRALGAPATELSLEFVFIGNIAAACIVGGALWLRGDLTPKHAAFATLLVFVVFTACLLNRYAVWLSALCGGLAMSIAPAAILAGIGLKVGSELGAWIGGALGLLLGLGASFSNYRDIASVATGKKRG